MDLPVRPVARHAHACSCEVLVEIARSPEVAALLATHGVDARALAALRADTHASMPAEPGDWRARVPASATTEPVQRLLAIVRSADCHGYRLLELAGVPCPSLRRQVVDRRPRGTTLRTSSTTRPRITTTRAMRDPAPPRAPRPAIGERTPSPRRPRERPAAIVETKPEPVAEPARATAPEPRAIERDPTPIDPQHLASIFGREQELAALADATTRRGGRPVLLLGPSGCGRTLLASHLAIATHRPTFLLSAPDYADDDEHRLRRDLAAVGDGIAIFDDFDRLVLEAAPAWLSDLTQAWVRDRPRIVPVLSPESAGRLAQWIPGVLDIADVVRVESLEGPALGDAVTAGAPAVLAAHGIALDAEARAVELVRLSDRFLTGLAQPGRALDLLDLACARTRRRGATSISRTALHELVAERAQLPIARVAGGNDRDVLELDSRLAARVIGHTHALTTIAELVRRNRAGLGGARPILGALLLGPSGVGKTEIAKALAWSLFDREDALVRLDMSEYSEPHAVARIVGAPPGYVGYEQGGTLTNPLVRQPHCVVLLDEIEKAHRDVHQVLLQILDEGRLTDGRGRTVDFRHAAIIMTSNLGADRMRRVAGRARMDEPEVLAIARAAFPVELWNRIEAPLVMQPLSTDDLRKICRRIAKASSDRLLHERGVRYSLSDAACEHLVVRAGTDPGLGARPLRHLLTREIDPLVADTVLRGRVRAGDAIAIDVEHGRLVVT
jgi:ATP-dependent Clp protease ATP-binding subunit ClpC